MALDESNLSLEYIAGFFDGEGCISLTPSHYERKNAEISAPRPRVIVSNTNKPVILAIQNKIGGRLQIKERTDWRTCYDLVWGSWSEVRRVLTLLLPYLVVKRKEAELMLSLPPAKLGRYSGDVNLVLAEAVGQMRELKTARKTKEQYA